MEKIKGKNVFIIGMRRSGTSILRQLVNSHEEVENILFEPHETFMSIQAIHIPRYSKVPYLNEALKQFEGHSRWFGAKFALNAGIEAMNWKWLDDKFDNPHYIFIIRNPESTYASWIKIETSLRGTVDYDLYLPWYEHITKSFEEFTTFNIDRSCVIKYENLLSNADEEMIKVSNLLKINSFSNLNHMIKKPNN